MFCYIIYVFVILYLIIISDILMNKKQTYCNMCSTIGTRFSSFMCVRLEYCGQQALSLF